MKYMTDDATTSNDAPVSSGTKPALSRRDRWIKRSFLVIVIILCVAVYMYQRRDTTIEGWSENLDGAIEQAGQEKRCVVIFFTGSPPSEIARRVKIRIRRPGNIKAMEKGNYISVVATIDSSTSKLAEKYRIKKEKLPILVILAHDGKEITRHEGDIGEQEFREFLQIEK